ncbi:unnamed protein product [Cuscuta epithymum]|uniref:Uncharacterized protein n=1 Tax=Cuscuta epithymum TaxID=186058 RepID=A0AAV0CB63_9ASTE|nr:unnamed protein product [Cuscuta epithymum]
MGYAKSHLFLPEFLLSAQTEIRIHLKSKATFFTSSKLNQPFYLYFLNHQISLISVSAYLFE